MSGTAETPAEAIAFEFAATIAELGAAHAFLRGTTPGLDYWNSVEGLFKKGSNKVAVEGQVLTEEEGMKVAEDKARKELIEMTRRQFCADAVIIIAAMEGISMIFVSAYLFIMPSNLAGAAGSAAVSKAQLLT